MVDEKSDERLEEHLIVLDFLPQGYSDDSRPIFKREGIIQGIGDKHFTLLEAISRKGVHLNPHERVYIGPNKRDKVHHVRGRIGHADLTETAKIELKYVVKELVLKNEKRFVEFFNKSTPLTTRLHQLELIPGIGKKHMWAIIEARKERDFTSFGDIKERVKLLPDPQMAITKRILRELYEKEKYYLFVTPPRRK
jgi:putative nucleotide binding protein